MNLSEAESKGLFDQALNVLHGNDRGDYIMPNSELYPHQWLWDSCFIAIGLRHLDVERAQKELGSLVRGQWANGMLPHLIFDPHPRHHREHNLWQSWLNPHAPNGVITSGITQPPLLAEAVVRVGQRLKLPQRRSWYKLMYPHILAYHDWLYNERAGTDGLIVIVHPYESGMDNSPPLVHELREHAWPWWVKLLEKSGVDNIANLVRRDVRHVDPAERASNIEAIAQWALLKRLRSQAWDSRKILENPRFGLQDIAFNSIFVRANKHLVDIAKTIGKPLPDGLKEDMRRTRENLENLWDEETGFYLSRCLTGESIHEPTLAGLLPLYAGSISKDRAEHLVGLLNKRSQFKANFPLPTVPLGSPLFSPLKYWQGPVWINMNWLIIDGLKNYGFHEEAEKLRQKTLELVAAGGCYEYFSPLDGTPAGAENFSWTAALAIDLLQQN